MPEGDGTPVARTVEALRITEYAQPAEHEPAGYTIADSPLADVAPWFTGRIVDDEGEIAQIADRVNRGLRRERRLAGLRTAALVDVLAVVGGTMFGTALLVVVGAIMTAGGWSW